MYADEANSAPSVSETWVLTFGNTGTSQHNKLLSFWLCRTATVRRDFHYIASRYPGMVRGHGCIDFDDGTEDKRYVSTLSGRYKAGETRKLPPNPRSSRMELLFSTPAPPVWNWQNVWSTPKVKVVQPASKIANELGGFPHVEATLWRTIRPVAWINATMFSRRQKRALFSAHAGHIDGRSFKSLIL